MYARIDGDNKVVDLINNKSFKDENNILHARDVFRKWSTADFAVIDMYIVTNAEEPEYDHETHYSNIIPLEIGDDFAPQQWTTPEAYSQEQLNKNAENAVAELGTEQISRPLEDFVQFCQDLGLFTEEQIIADAPYVHSKKVAKEDIRKKIK